MGNSQSSRAQAVVTPTQTVIGNTQSSQEQTVIAPESET